MLRWARRNRALFSTFFHFFVETCPQLALFGPLFAPYACRCDDASGAVWSPSSVHSVTAPSLSTPLAPFRMVTFPYGSLLRSGAHPREINRVLRFIHLNEKKMGIF